MSYSADISWEDFKKVSMDVPLWEAREQTHIACPNCGKPLWRRNDIVLTSYPAQYQYECDNCSWVGYAYR